MITMDQTQLLARYQRLRKVGMEVNTTIVKRLSKDMLDEGGHKLGLLRKQTLVLDSQDEIAVLMDFCIHDVRRQGRTAVEQFFAESPYPAGSDEGVYLQALTEASFSLFQVEALEPGVGVQVRDLVREETRRIVDVGFSRTAEPRLLMAFRLIEPDNIAMTSGAALPVGVQPKHGGAEILNQVVAAAKGFLASSQAPEHRSEGIAALIQSLLEAGTASHIAYTDPGEQPRSASPRVGRPSLTNGRPGQVGRNSPCPCGSGKKFKHCCGRGR